MAPLNLPAPTICDMSCFLEPEHPGPHQFTRERQEWLRENRKEEKMDKNTALDFLKMLDFCDANLTWPNHIWKTRVRLEGEAKQKLGLLEDE